MKGFKEKYQLTLTIKAASGEVTQCVVETTLLESPGGEGWTCRSGEKETNYIITGPSRIDALMCVLQQQLTRENP